jgi:alkanesulfonate monooxygenase SsuD/methylene tetrahydromethanopterin reductase-like flavin-dependent oxidoreductase (luciferase family)
MDVRILAESQQGTTYEEQLTLAQALEGWGYDGFFRSDHLQREGTAIGEQGPTDVWVTLAGLARETSRIRLGSLMCSSTFRNPAHLAIIVAQIDAMSHGRIELGLGAGSYPPEHYSLDFPLPSFGERFDAVEEQLELITGLWTAPLGQLYSYQGKQYRVQDYPALVRPAQTPHPAIIIGGHGLKRTPALAARYANEYNIDGVGPAACTQAYDRVRQALRTHRQRPHRDHLLGRSHRLLRPGARRPRQTQTSHQHCGVGLEGPRSGHRGRRIRAARGRRQPTAGIPGCRGRARVPAAVRPDRPRSVGAHRARGVAAPPLRHESHDRCLFNEVVNRDVI